MHYFFPSEPNLLSFYAETCFNVKRYLPAKKHKEIKKKSSVVFCILALVNKYSTHQITWRMIMSVFAH